MATDTIVVGSLGRSGSTALYKSMLDVVGYSIRKSKFQNNLDDCPYKRNAIYKTHDFPPSNPPNYVTFIWTFADPYEIVLSVLNQENEKGMNWILKHFEHLNGEFYKYDDILNYDCLHLEEHFDRWYQNHNFPLLTIKYRSVWHRQNDLSRFVGSYVDLPPFSDRDSRFKELDDDKREMLEDTYGDLHDKIEKAESFKVW